MFYNLNAERRVTGDFLVAAGAATAAGLIATVTFVVGF